MNIDPDRMTDDEFLDWCNSPPRHKYVRINGRLAVKLLEDVSLAVFERVKRSVERIENAYDKGVSPTSQ